MSAKPPIRPPIAVVGVSALFPGSDGSASFWRNITNGSDLLTEVPPTHWLLDDYYDPDPKAEDKTYARRGGFLPSVDFDALHWGVPPRIIEATDTTQLLALILAQKVLEDAFGSQFQEMDRSRMSVILGITASQELMGHMVSRLQRPVWQKCLRDAGIEESRVQEICQSIADQYVPWQESTFPGLLGNVVAGRIANRLNLGGTNCVTDAACASTFSALSMALNELYLGDSDVVLVGGADTMNDPFMYMCFSKTPAMSPSGDCRPFSEQADGTMLGEGIGMVALKRLDDAKRDGDRVYAVLRGMGTSSDGRSKSVYAPVSEGQAKALRRAYTHAGYGPDTVELVEAHGTGTKAGDAAEFDALRTVFQESGRMDPGWCAIGTVKSQIGHTKAAAGAAGLFKAVMALHHKVLPPTIKVEQPNSAMQIATSPFHINTRARPWVRTADHPRRASVSSFGFGGSNFHLTLEEVTGTTHRASRIRCFSHELILLGEDSPGALVGVCRDLAGQTSSGDRLQWLAWKTQTEFQADKTARLALVAKDERDLVSKLESAAKQIEAEPGTAFSAPTGMHYGFGPSQGGIAFLFPGQGSQYVDMGAQLSMSFSACMRAWEDATRIDLNDPLRLDQVVFPPTAFDEQSRQDQQALLTRTEWAQPAIGCTSLSMLRLLRTMGLEPDLVGGHSFGEVTALYAAGALGPEDFLRVARKRGEMMARAARTPGAMTAVSHPVGDIQTALNRWRSPVVIANINAPQQVVLSGRVADIEAVEAEMTAAGMRFKRLPVATAFHSPVVADSSRPFGRYLGHIAFEQPTVPVFANTTGRVHGDGAPATQWVERTRESLAAQISRPVRFVEMIENMAEAGIHTFLEVGPGSVLTGLVGRILEDQPHAAISMDRKGRAGVLSLWNALGQLSARGIRMDLSALWDEYAVPVDPAEIATPRMAVNLGGANYGRPYPPAGGVADLPEPNRVDAELENARVEMAAAHEAALAAIPTPTVSDTPEPPIESPVQPWQPSSEWIQSFEDAQRKTADAHTAYQESMSSAHAAYLQTAEAGFAALRSLMETEDGSTSSFQGIPEIPSSPAPVVSAPAPAPAPVVSTPAPAPAPVVSTPAPAPAPVVSTPAPVPAPVVSAPAPVPVVSTPAPAPAPVISTPAPAPAPVVSTPAPVPAPVVSAPAPAPVISAPAPAPAPVVSGDSGLRQLLLDVVSDKTGYPAEMLELSMQLEGDLGIDSIKRVEILSAMQEARSDLPEVDPAAMAGLRTLGQIVDYLDDAASSGAPTPAAPNSAPAPVISTPAPAPAPVVSTPAPVPAPVVSAPAPAPAPVISGDSGLRQLLLDVVSDKTGYPAEMLELSMQLEGDLGIDSIKRVEILSAMQEARSDLPEVDPAAMAGLRTLGQIVDYLEGAASSGAPTPAPVAPAPAPVVSTPAPAPAPVVSTPAPAPAPVVSTPAPAPVISAPAPAPAPVVSGDSGLRQLLLDVVSDKTGYPAEMLELSMQLEGDLGIDSIKRVEILSAMQEARSDLPEVDPAAMAGLRTLGQIVDYLEGAASSGAPTPTPAPVAPAPAPVVSTPAPAPAPAPVISTPTPAPAPVVSAPTPAPAPVISTPAPAPAPVPVVSAPAPAPAPVVSAPVPTPLPPTPVATPGPTPSALPPAPSLSATMGLQPADHGLVRSVLRTKPSAAPGLAAHGLFGAGALWVVDEGTGIAVALIEELRRRGVKAHLIDRVERLPRASSGLVYLGGLVDVDDPSRAIEINREAFQTAGVLGRVLTETGLFVTVQDTGGDYGLSGELTTARACLSGLAGLARTAAREWPDLTVRSIDLERGDRSARELGRVLCEELMQGGAQRDTGLRATGERLTLVDEAIPVRLGASSLQLGDLVVVSGGAKGVTAASVIALSRRIQARYLLLGRSELTDEAPWAQGVESEPELKRALMREHQARGRTPHPRELGQQVRRVLSSREIRRTLEAIKHNGSEGYYATVDVTDANAVAAVLSGAREQWGPIKGLVHGAGVIADKLIVDKPVEDYDRVIGTKVGGLMSLLGATREDPLRLLCLFSSVAARTGNRGQCDYAMANEMLNKMAQVEARRRADCRVCSLGWGPWEGGMVSPQLKARFESFGVPMIPLDVGAKMMVDEVFGAQTDQVELLLGGPPEDMARLSASEERLPLRLEVMVHRNSHPYLMGHAIEGTPVIPVVLVAEWFQRMVRLMRGPETEFQIRQLKVLRGVRLDALEGVGHRLILRAEWMDSGSIGLELRSPDGILHYSARAEDAEEGLVGLHPPLLSLQPWGSRPVYGDVLFHGPQFQVIESIEGVGEDGISGELSGLELAGWAEEPWVSDVAVLDGALQLALLWGSHVLGLASLPTRIGTLRWFASDAPLELTRAILTRREITGSRTLSDILLVDDEGVPVAELCDVETHALPRRSKAAGS